MNSIAYPPPCPVLSTFLAVGRDDLYDTGVEVQVIEISWLQKLRAMGHCTGGVCLFTITILPPISG